MIKPWKELEGQPLRFDVNSTYEEALAATEEQASTIYLTTNKRIVMNGEILSEGIVLTGNLASLTTDSTDEEIRKALTGKDSPTEDEMEIITLEILKSTPLVSRSLQAMGVGNMGLVRTIMCGMDLLFQNFIFVFIRANSTAAYLCHLVIHYDSTQKTYSVTKLTKMPITA